MRLLVVTLLLATTLTWAQGESRPSQAGPSTGLIEELEALEARTTQYADPAMSPDGKQVAWQAKVGAAKGEIFLLNRSKAGAMPQPVGNGSSPAWSLDSLHLAYLSDSELKGQDQVWIVDIEGHRRRTLTDLRGYVAQPRWSPDGMSIACLYIPGGPGGGPTAATEPRVGEIEGVIRNQRVAIVDVPSGRLHFGSPANLHVYAFDWSPDGMRLAVTAAPGPGDNNWWNAQLYVTDATTGHATVIYKPRWQLAVPRWSPDGKQIAFIEGLMSDEGYHGGDLMVIAAEGGPARNLTHGRPASANGMFWRSNARILFAEIVGGGSALAELETATGTATRLWQGNQTLVIGGAENNFALAADGQTSVIIRQDFSTPPEVWAGPIGAWQQLAQSNAKVKAQWGQAESLIWESDGHMVQGWLIHPRDERPGQRYPLVVRVHGGPADVVTPGWDPSGSGLLPMAGYFFLRPNPRGSYGQGEAFTQANIKDFGGGDLRDILAGVDKVLTSFPVDAQRVGLQGWSYGGFMTMWAVTQSQRFAAAVAGAGTANWKSYYGQNGIDQWMLPYFGASVYDDPAAYAKCSPIEFIKQAKTPTLVLVGELDAEAPAPQSFEFWHGLKAHGVPTKLVVYPGEGHAFIDPANQRDKYRRTLAWFDKYLKPEAGK